MFNADSNIDFNSSMYQTGYVTGTVVLNTLNKGMGKSINVKLFGSGSNTLNYESDWSWVANNPPLNILDQKNVFITLTCFGTGYLDVFGTWAAQV